MHIQVWGSRAWKIQMSWKLKSERSGASRCSEDFQQKPVEGASKIIHVSWKKRCRRPECSLPTEPLESVTKTQCFSFPLPLLVWMPNDRYKWACVLSLVDMHLVALLPPPQTQTCVTSITVTAEEFMCYQRTSTGGETKISFAKMSPHGHRSRIKLTRLSYF